MVPTVPRPSFSPIFASNRTGATLELEASALSWCPGHLSMLVAQEGSESLPFELADAGEVSGGGTRLSA